MSHSILDFRWAKAFVISRTRQLSHLLISDGAIAKPSYTYNSTKLDPDVAKVFLRAEAVNEAWQFLGL
jgi:hypothetical protein